MSLATLSTEAELWAQGHRVVVGLDEVGRGAWAGPLVVGACAVTADLAPTCPPVADSKLVAAKRREALSAQVLAWATVSLGEVSAAEIDAVGMAAALRLACCRALAGLGAAGIVIDAVIQDGSASWLCDDHRPPVALVRPKSDRDCASVAAASLVAKVSRDRWMRTQGARYPNWPALATSAGYGTAAHADQIRTHGVCTLHRMSWSFVERLTGERVTR